MIKQEDTPGIHALHRDARPERVADIIFLHGLGGKSHSTWRRGKPGEVGYYFWPEELAGERPEWGVWTVGYDASFTGAGVQGMLISQRARSIASQLINLEFGDRPIIFVTHSMGGLIVKSLIVQSLGRGDQPLGMLVARIRGVVFCGTPHRGSAIASAANLLEKFYSGAGAFFFGLPGLLFGALAAKLLGTQAHVKQMAANEIQLDELHDDFIKWQRQNGIPVECYAESRKLRRWLPLGLVVERTSANANIDRPHEVDADHLELVKPPPPGHPIHNIVYLGVRRFIEQALQRPEIKPPPGFPGTPETYRILMELRSWLPKPYSQSSS